jgi:hypothetical protein
MRMKIKILLVALFAGGLLASMAIAKPSPPGHDRDGRSATTATTTTTTTTTTTPTTTTRHDEHGEHKQPPCRNVELKGTVSGGSLSFVVAGKHAKLAGQTLTLTVAGNVSVEARACGSTGSPTYTVRELHADGRPAPATTTTTTTTTTTHP